MPPFKLPTGMLVVSEDPVILPPENEIVPLPVSVVLPEIVMTGLLPLTVNVIGEPP